MNPYTVLDVHRKSTDEEIRNSFIALAKKYHPDMNENFMEEFQKINAAYKLIRTEKNRLKFFNTIKLKSNESPKCNGEGTREKTKSITEKIYSKCHECSGLGVILKKGDLKCY